MQNSTSYWFNKIYFQTGEEHRFNLVWLLVFSLGILFIGLGLRDPWPADEPRFAQIAREMVESGQWFFPMRGGELYPDKPPIFMWSIALFYQLTGSMSVSFLLPSALCSMLTTFLIYDLGRRLWSTSIGWYAAIILLVSIQFVLQAKSAQIDAMVCCWITIGCYGLARHLLLGDGWRWYFLGFFFMGIGIITKGVGFLPILMLIPYLIVRLVDGKPNEIKGFWGWPVGLVVMVGVTLLWFIPMIYWVDQSHDPLFEAYRDNILFKQTGERYAKSWHHIKPFWFFIVEVIPLFWLPISLFIPWLSKRWWQAIKHGDRRIILLLGWIVLLLVFFSVSPGKRGVYILPAMPILALISAPYVKQLFQKNWPSSLLWWLILVISMVVSAISIAGLLDTPALIKPLEKYNISPWFYFLIFGISGLLVCGFTKKRKVYSWLIAVPIAWIIYSTWGYQLLNPIKTPRLVLQNVERHLPSGAEISMVRFREQFLLFSPVPFTHFGYHTNMQQSQRAAWQWQGHSDKRFLMGYMNAKMPCYDLTKGIDVGFAHGKHWLLLSSDARNISCDAPNKSVKSFTFTPKNVL